MNTTAMIGERRLPGTGDGREGGILLVDAENGVMIKLVPGLPAEDKDRILRQACRETEVGNRVLAFYLWDLKERGEAQLLGYPSAVAYAHNRLRMPRRSARDLVDAGEALAGLRKIDEAFARGEIVWSRVRLLATIATPETEEAWLERAKVLSWDSFDLEVKTGEKGKPPRTHRKGLPEMRIKVPVKLDPLAHEVWLQAKKKLGAERGEPVTDAEALRAFAWMFLATTPDGAVFGRDPETDSPFRVSVHWCPGCHAPEVDTEDGRVPVAAETAARMMKHAEVTTVREFASDEGHSIAEDLDRETPKWMRDEVLARDGFRCSHCRSRRRLMAHHIVWRSLGGPTTPTNMTAACVDCHILIHARFLFVEGEAPHGLRWTSKSGEATSAPAGPDVPVTLLLAPAAPTPPACTVSAPAPTAEVSASTAVPVAVVEPVAVSLRTLPAVILPEMWPRIEHLAQWNDRRGLLSFEAGSEQQPDPKSEPEPESGLAADASSVGTPPSHRPAGLDQIVGQPRAVATLRAAVRAAKKCGDPVNHTVLLGGPGLGKTSLARAVAAEMGTRAHVTSGPHLRDVGVLIQLLTRLRPRDVLCIDEIHALPPRVTEALYEAMEDRVLNVPVTDGTMTRTLQIRLHPFTLIGATTETADLPKPLMMRFVVRELLEWYGTDELARIVERAAVRQGLGIESAAVQVIARAGRDTPREALGLLARVRNDALAADVTVIDAAFAASSLAAQGIDREGLDPMDRRILAILRGRREPIGQNRLAALLGTTPKILREVHEPFLARRGLLVTTPRGRMASPGEPIARVPSESLPRPE